MGKRRASNDTQRANLRGGGFVAIPHVVADSPAWRGSSLLMRALMLEIVRAHNGYNNGQIARSQRQIADAVATTNFRAISRAVAEAIQRGFLSIEAEGTVWTRQAREYRVTWLPTGKPPHVRLPTDEWKAFSSDDAVSARSPISADTGSARRKFPADTVAAAKMEKRLKSTPALQALC
jgi:hypothetical protein